MLFLFGFEDAESGHRDASGFLVEALCQLLHAEVVAEGPGNSSDPHSQFSAGVSVAGLVLKVSDFSWLDFIGVLSLLSEVEVEGQCGAAVDSAEIPSRGAPLSDFYFGDDLGGFFEAGARADGATDLQLPREEEIGPSTEPHAEVALVLSLGLLPFEHLLETLGKDIRLEALLDDNVPAGLLR